VNHIQCSHKTRKGKPCPFHADRTYEGLPVCHVHDPNGLAAQNRHKPQGPRKPPKARPPVAPANAPTTRPEASTPPASALQTELAAIGKAQRMMAQRLEEIERRLNAMYGH